MSFDPPPQQYFYGINFNYDFFISGKEFVTREYVDNNFLKAVGYAYSRALSTSFNGIIYALGGVSTTTLTASGTVTANLFSGSGASLTSLNASNISGGTLAVNIGGTGKTNLTSTQILVGNNTNPVTQSGNLTWDNSLNILNASNISGNGSRLTNLNASNVSDGTLVVTRGGTGANNFTAGRLLLGNGTNAITENGNLTWTTASNTLTVTGSTTADNVAIGTTTVGPYKLMVVGDVSISGAYRIGNNAIVSSQWTTSGTTIEYNGGSVGIGTSPFAFRLNVNGTINAIGLITSAGLTSSSLITANAGLSIPAGQTLTSAGTLTANIINASGLITGNNNLVIAGSAGIVGTSQFTGNMGIGTAASADANTKLNVSGDINIVGNNRYRIGGNAIGNWLAGTIPTDIYYTAGNVSIGSINTSAADDNTGLVIPTARLFVRGGESAGGTCDVVIRGGVATQNGGKARLWLAGDASHATYIQGEHTTGGNSVLTFGTASGNNLPVERMRLDNLGNVGIGTNNPTNILQVGNGGRLRVGTSNDFTLIGANDLDNDANTRVVLVGSLSSQNPSSIFYLASGAGSHSFETTSGRLARMRINNNGNVAIQGFGGGIGPGSMAAGSLCLGNTNQNYGGGQNWNSNTAGFLMECLDATEIAVHDAGNVVHSFMYYSGSNFRIGRNMLWGNASVTLSGVTTCDTTLNVNGNSNLRNTYIYSGNESSNIGLYFATPFFGTPTGAAKSAIITEAITNHSRHHLAFCMNRDNNNGINVSASGQNIYMRLHQDNFIEMFKQLRIYNELFAGFTAVNRTNTDYLCVQQDYGAIGGYNTNWIRVAFGSFTGFHRCYTDDELYNNETDESIDLFKNNFIGRVVIATGKIKTDFSRKKETSDESELTEPDKNKSEPQEWYSEIDKDGITIEDAVPVVRLSRQRKDKRVFGVFGGLRSANNKDRLIVNSIGEGGICVSNTNGNIENGDYIQSSDLLGYGEKQDDDLLHNYTIAKSTIDCNFELDSPYYQCHEIENGVRVAFIACSYHCG